MGLFGRPEPKLDTENSDAMDTAWKIRGAVVDWTGKVDAKAAFAFTIESAALATMIAFSGEGRVFGHLDGPVQNITYFGAAALLLLSAASALLVVTPRLRLFKVKKEWPENFIYFGHLKSWDPARLGSKIQETDMLPVLTKQLVTMSKICWNKHQWVAISFILAALAGVSLLVCALLVRAGLPL